MMFTNSRKIGNHWKTMLILFISIVLILMYIFWDRSSTEFLANSQHTSTASTVLANTKYNYTRRHSIRYGQECYAETPFHSSSFELLPDVMSSKELLEKGENIFFHQTTCQNNILNLTVRQACAIESAAFTNPDSNVFLLFASPTGLSKDVERPPIVRALDAYKNIRMHNIDIWNYTQNTPARDWIYEPTLFASNFMGTNLADLLRLVSLHKFGGTYVDLDMIVIRNLKELGHNYAGFETEGMLTNSLMNFKADGIGHFLVEELIKEFVSTYNSTQWGANGPVLLTHVLKNICRTSELEKCTIFTAFPIHTFYPIFWAWKRLFDPTETEKALNEASGSMTVHFWNHMSANERVAVGKKSLYDVLAKGYCPLVYATIKDDTFF